MKAYALIVFSLAIARQLTAQGLEPRPVPARGVEVYSYRSPSMGNRYEILVGTKAGFRAVPGKKYPALIVTDGYGTFPVALDAMRSLSGSIEDFYVISVGTPLEEGDSAFTRRRIYEFSPPDWAMTDPFGTGVSSICKAYHTPADRCVGGAPKFLELIVSELLPLLEAKFPIDHQQLGLFGLSAGGFFASYAIFQPISPFKKYIISSPAMAYGDGEIFRQEERYSADHKDMNAAIYFAAGSLEIDDPYLEGTGHIVSGMTHLSAMLEGRHYASLKLHTEIHYGLGHSDGAGTTLVRGMRLLYAK